jgi:predicted MFS family arabinose efflux permease
MERIILLVLAAVQFTNIVDFMVVMPLAPDLMESLHIGPARFSLIVSSYTFAASVAGFLAAFCIDRFDRKRAFLTLYGGFLVGNTLCAVAPNYSSLVAARIFTGAFGGIIGGMALAIIGDIFPEHRRGSATGVLMTAFAVASVAGVPFGLYLGEHFGWNAPFVFLAILGTVVLAIGARVLPSIRSHLAHAAPADSAIADVTATLTHPNHVRAFILIATIMVGGFAVISFIGAYLVRNVGVPETRLPLVYVGGGVLTLFAAPAIGKLSDRFGKLLIYRIVAPIAAAMMLALTNLPPVHLAVAVAVVSVLMVANAGRMVAAMAMVTACVEPRRRGSFMSVNSSVQHLSAGLGAFLAGQIINETPQGALLYYDRVGILGVTATLISLYLAGRLRRATPADAPKPLGEPHHRPIRVDEAPAAERASSFESA